MVNSMVSTHNFSASISLDEKGICLLSITTTDQEILKLPNCQYGNDTFCVECYTNITNKVDFLNFLKENLRKEEKLVVFSHPIVCRFAIAHMQLYLEPLIFVWRRILFLHGIIQELEEDIRYDSARPLGIN